MNMTKTIVSLAAALLLAAPACMAQASADSWAGLVNEQTHALRVNGKSATWGDHTYKLQSGLTGTKVTFSHFPSGYTEFEALYTQWCSGNPYLTAAMMVWAIEIYARDAATGEQCIGLLNTSTNARTVTRLLKERFTHKPFEPGGTYQQRYFPAATLKGASASNGYRPKEPYTIEMRPSVNKDQNVTGGKVKFIYIMGDGWDTHQRQVEVFLPSGSKTHKMYNCPSLLTQCKPYTGNWNGLK